MKRTIKLSEPNMLTLEIEDSKGKKTGETLTFNLNDIELPAKIQKLYDDDRKLTDNFRKELVIINKRQDYTEKDHLYSKNKEAEMKLRKDYIIAESKIFDEFLGENAVNKLLNGRPLGWDTLQEIDLIVRKQIVPCLNENALDYKKMIKDKYGVETNDVLK